MKICYGLNVRICRMNDKSYFNKPTYRFLFKTICPCYDFVINEDKIWVYCLSNKVIKTYSLKVVLNDLEDIFCLQSIMYEGHFKCNCEKVSNEKNDILDRDLFECF